MIIKRYAVCILLLTIWANVSLAAQESIITTVAGNGHGAFAGDGGPASEASLNMPGSVAVDAKGNVYIADWQNHRIRKINPAGIISTVAGNGQRGFSGDGGPAVDASLDLMYVDRFWAAGGIALDSLGNLYIADTNNHRIRKVDLNGVITTVVGGSVSTTLNYPSGITVDHEGSIYIAETGTGQLRKASPDGTVSVLVCCFTRATGVAVDGEGNIYVADAYYNYDGMVFKVDTTSGKIKAMAEGKSFEYSPGTFFYPPWSGPWSLVVDPNGDLLIAETANRIVKLTRNEDILRIAGNNDGPDYSGDGGPARQAALAYPFGVALDAAGNIYVADTYNNRIRMIGSAIPTVSVNSTFCAGSSWSLQVSKAAASSDIRLLGSSNGLTWEIPGWRTTQADGTFIETGTFAEGTQGSHTLRLQIAGTFSTTISFVVSDCRR
jgi:trimeric autotransporter adhesin